MTEKDLHKAQNFLNSANKANIERALGGGKWFADTGLFLYKEGTHPVNYDTLRTAECKHDGTADSPPDLWIELANQQLKNQSLEDKTIAAFIPISRESLNDTCSQIYHNVQGQLNSPQTPSTLSCNTSKGACK